MIKIAIDLLDHWQTLFAGILALLAGFGTVVATMIIARRQIAASREEAEGVIAATREQTWVTAEQTRTTERLQKMRDASEAKAFHVMLEAAMARVFAEAAWARKTYPHILGQAQGASIDAQGRRCPYRSPVHHQRRVRGIARRLRRAGQPLDRRVSRPRTRDRQLRNAVGGQDRHRWVSGPMGQARRSERTACLDRNEGGRSARKGRRAISMIRIGITAEAFRAIARTLPLGSVAYEAEPNEPGRAPDLAGSRRGRPAHGHARTKGHL